MILADILRSKGSHVLTISPGGTLDDVVQKLVEKNCGSLIVCEAVEGGRSRMAGIITERDILRACAKWRSDWAVQRVSAAMTAQPITGTPTDRVEDTMGLMTDKRIRHLPILDGEELVGLISIGDLVKAQHDQFAVENHYMKSYIMG